MSNPQALPILNDFKPYYQQWLINSFPISEENASLITADYPSYFAVAFHENILVNQKRYIDLIKWCNNPLTQEWATSTAREKYKINLKKSYQQAALGEENVALSDVYTQPSFLVFDKSFSEKKQKEIRKQNENENENEIKENEQFLPIPFEGSIHDYLSNNFVNQKKSKSINSNIEKQRMLILLGHPGHGKSSFCYRSINDLLRNPKFNGNTFFIRLQNVERNIINNPLTQIEEWLPKEINFTDWIDEKYQQKNILFLDGLDEMFMTQSLTDEEVLTLINNLKKLLDKRPNLFIIITSRFNYIETSKLYNGDCLLFSLGTLTIKQQNELIVKFRKRNPKKKCNLDEKFLQKCNEDNRFNHIKELIELPILLQMILISEIEIEDTKTRANIYSELFDTVLNRKWDRDQRLKKYRDTNNFQPKHLREYISLLAYKIYKNNKGYIHKSEVENLEETENFKRRRLRIEGSEEDLKNILKDILTSFYLKESRKDKDDNIKQDIGNEYAIEFLHKSLYEFLTCEYIWIQVKEFFLEWDSKNEEFKRHDIFKVLEKIQEIFSQIRLSRELIGYLKEIIDNDKEYHDNLRKQMDYYLGKLLKYGFLYESKRTDSKFTPNYSVIQQSLNCFHGFWLIYGQLNQYKLKESDFLKNPFIEFKKNILANNIEKTIIEAFNKYIDDTINLESGRRYFMPGIDKKIKKTLNLERRKFPEWLSDIKNRKTKYSIIFERWFNSYFQFSCEKEKFKLSFLTKSSKEKEILENFIRLTADNDNYIGYNFSNYDFKQINLPFLTSAEINCYNANLTSANLFNAYLRGGIFFNADLKYAHIFNADLMNCSLQFSQLQYANLKRAFLINSNLSNSSLFGAELGDTYLEDATIFKCDMRFTNLSNSKLVRANLSYSNFYHSDLSNTNCQGADLSFALFSNSNFSNIDLDNAIVDNKNWINQLESKNIKGIDWIKRNFYVDNTPEEINTIDDKKQKGFRIKNKNS